ncbi:hypothetical protein HPL003_22255 [Paenibacillus terrae HPL-003]|uniref:Uncharacterized protein n=1 Tax=Paenibacillus terrae (strain HPL-003) TaxID=985665 RepID=G7VQI8_PAETH|nr:hypothetical protein HPL003_22255 [Paenibacillus terrae HPL-003]
MSSTNLGIGAAIVNYPLLLFVPAGLGVAHFSAQEGLPK